MRLVVYSTFVGFEQFLHAHLDRTFDFNTDFAAPRRDPDCVYLLHWHRDAATGYRWLKKYAHEKSVAAGVCADVPEIGEMLECAQLGARAYCNSHMAAIHYAQMLRLLGNGQSWFPPKMLAETFRIAQQAVNPPKPKNSIDMLTPREQEVARVVGAGKTNRQIAAQMKITESTVKSHLSRIFKKLGVKDRVTLVLYLKDG